MSDAKIKLPKAYVQIFKKHSRYKVLYGGRGSAKSWSCAKVALAMGFAKPLRILCAREIQRSISDSVHKLLSEQINELGLNGFYDITRDAIRGQNGTEFIFKGLRTNPQEIKSMEGIDICWVEEAQAVSQESWDVLIPTIRKPGSEIWVTFNPLDESDPTYQKFVIDPPDDAIVRKVNYNENPYFPEVLRQEMEWLKSRDYQAYLHIWEGEVRKHSNALVFGNYFKVEDFETPANTRFYHGADWGFAQDPSTLIRCFIDGKNLYIDREAWGIGVEIDNTPALFDTIETARKWPIKADCARPETISYMRRQGFNISPAKKWQGSIEDGIEFLKTFNIIIHPRCKHTIDEFNHYSYKVDKQTGDILPQIVDANNHCLVGDSLILCENGEKPIKDVKIGDLVYTRQGLKKVTWSGKTRENVRVYSVHAGNYVVTGTTDHQIYTVNRGWQEIGNIQEGDVLLCVWKQSKPTAKNGIDIPIQKDALIENISSEGQHGCIDMCGSKRMAKSLKAWLSITKMGIAKTMQLTIWNVLHRLNTGTDTLLQKNKRDGKKSILQILDRLQLIGTKAQKAVSGIANTPRSATSDTLKNCESASIVEKNLLQNPTTINSAPTLAKAHGEETPELTTRKEHARNVGKHSSLADTQRLCVVPVAVQTIELGEVEKAVYDLTVEDEHEFFANSVLVHNCTDALRYSLDGLIKGHGMMHINSKAVARAGIRRR